MANLVYNIFKKKVLQGSHNIGGNLYMSLVGSNYTPNGDTHAYWTDLTEVVTPSNYVNKFAVSAPVITTNNTTNQGVLDAADLLIATVTFGSAVRAGVLWNSSGDGAASDPLVAYIDFSSNQEVTAGTFQVTWNASGVLALT